MSAWSESVMRRWGWVAPAHPVGAVGWARSYAFAWLVRGEVMVARIKRGLGR